MSEELKHFEKCYELASNHNITFGKHMQKLFKERGIKDKWEFEEKQSYIPNIIRKSRKRIICYP